MHLYLFNFSICHKLFIGFFILGESQKAYDKLFSKKR